MCWVWSGVSDPARSQFRDPFGRGVHKIRGEESVEPTRGQHLEAAREKGHRNRFPGGDSGIQVRRHVAQSSVCDRHGGHRWNWLALWRSRRERGVAWSFVGSFRRGFRLGYGANFEENMRRMFFRLRGTRRGLTEVEVEICRRRSFQRSSLEVEICRRRSFQRSLYYLSGGGLQHFNTVFTSVEGGSSTSTLYLTLKSSGGGLQHFQRFFDCIYTAVH